VNAVHMRLFHHFRSFTMQTLVLPSRVWHHALQISFHFEFLMNAILSIAARHLVFLGNNNPSCSTAASSHLCRALSLFHKELSSKNVASIHVDAFIATSLLLQSEIWSDTDIYHHCDGLESAFDPSKDSLFNFSARLKHVFLKTLPQVARQPSVFMPYIGHGSMDNLARAARISNDTLAKHENFFSYHRPVTTERLNLPLPYQRGPDPAISSLWAERIVQLHSSLDPIDDGYNPVVVRLCLIQSFLPEAEPPETISSGSALLPTLARYVFSFPIQCHGPFASMIQKRDPHAILLLYHFYHAVSLVLPPTECWWAHRRAKLMQAALKDWLEEESRKQDEASCWSTLI